VSDGIIATPSANEGPVLTINLTLATSAISKLQSILTSIKQYEELIDHSHQQQSQHSHSSH
jgi:hypothetical protein